MSSLEKRMNAALSGVPPNGKNSTEMGWNDESFTHEDSLDIVAQSLGYIDDEMETAKKTLFNFTTNFNSGSVLIFLSLS